MARPAILGKPYACALPEQAYNGYGPTIISLYNIALPVTSLGPAAKERCSLSAWGTPSSREVVICKSVSLGPVRLAG